MGGVDAEESAILVVVAAATAAAATAAVASDIDGASLHSITEWLVILYSANVFVS